MKKIIGMEETLRVRNGKTWTMETPCPSWVEVVSYCWADVVGGKTSFAWGSDLKFSNNVPLVLTGIRPLWNERDAVVALLDAEGVVPVAVFFGDEMRVRGMEFLSRSKCLRIQILEMFEEVM